MRIIASGNAAALGSGSFARCAPRQTATIFLPVSTRRHVHGCNDRTLTGATPANPLRPCFFETLSELRCAPLDRLIRFVNDAAHEYESVDLSFEASIFDRDTGITQALGVFHTLITQRVKTRGQNQRRRQSAHILRNKGGGAPIEGFGVVIQIMPTIITNDVSCQKVTLVGLIRKRNVALVRQGVD